MKWLWNKEPLSEQLLQYLKSLLRKRIFRVLITLSILHGLSLYNGDKGSCLFCTGWHFPLSNDRHGICFHMYPCQPPRKMVENIQTPNLSRLGRECAWEGGLFCRNPDEDCTVRLLTHVLCKPTHFFFHSFIATMSYSLQTSFNSVRKDWADKYHVWGTPTRSPSRSNSR